MDLSEKQLSSEYFYRGKIINMRRDNALLPDGSEAFREVVEHPGGVGVCPLTDEGEVLLVRQFRYPYFEEILEIPAGKLDPDETPVNCGIRELLEETGARAENVFPLGKIYPTPGYTTEIIHVFGATGLSFENARPDEGEFLEPVRIPLEKAYKMVMSGEITDAKTQIAVLKIWNMKQNNEI